MLSSAIILAVAGAACVAAKANTAIPLPIVLATEPTAVTTAAWIKSDEGGSGDAELVSLLVNATVPSVNLDQVFGFAGVQCTQNSTTVWFSSMQYVAEWTVKPTLLLISEQFPCGRNQSQEFGMRLATSWTVDKTGGRVVFNTTDPEASGIKADFKLDVATIPASSISNSSNTSSHLFARSNDKRTGFSLNIPIRYDINAVLGVDESTDRSSLRTGVWCAPCRFYGNSKIVFSAYGSLFPMSLEISLDWKGSMRTTFDVLFDFKYMIPLPDISGVTSKRSAQYTIVNIPGLILFSPTLEFYLEYGAMVSLTPSLRIIGDFNMPDFHFSVSTKHGFKFHGLLPTFTPSFDIDAEVAGTVYLRIITAIDMIGLKIMGHEFGNRLAEFVCEPSGNLYTNIHNEACVDFRMRSYLQTPISNQSRFYIQTSNTAVTTEICLNKNNRGESNIRGI